LKEDDFSVGIEIWLELDGQYLAGRREIDILENIHKLGSFMMASKTLGISYAYAWNSIDKIQKILKINLVEAVRGGVSGGGGATLTKAGLNLIKKYQTENTRAHKAISRPGKITKINNQSKNIKIPDLTIIGSDSIGIHLIIELMIKEQIFTYEIADIGSSGGLNAIMLGEADIAGIHLIEDKTNTYNTTFLQKYWIHRKTVLVRGYKRTQGLIVKKGNPKQISSFKDLLRKEVKIINRNLGSGTRTLLDNNIQKIANEKDLDVNDIIRSINGYNHEVTSHQEIAKAVLKGDADVGLGVEVPTVRSGLEFIPICEEWFDFAFDSTKIKKPIVEKFWIMLKSDKLKKLAIRRAPELIFTDQTGITIYHP
jgi:molybdate transport repressor ModE-like protein